jgi:hypothetical protein
MAEPVPAGSDVSPGSTSAPAAATRDPDTGACRSPHNEQTPDPIKEKVRTDVKHTPGLEESEQSDQAEPDFRIHEPGATSRGEPPKI